MIYLLFIFLFFSVFFGMFGLGGGVLYIPAQLFVNVSYNEAATVSLFLITVTSISSSIVYFKKKLIDWKMVLILMVFSIVGSFSGGFFSGLVGQTFQILLFSAIAFSNGALMLKKPASTGGVKKKTRFSMARKVSGESYFVNLAIAIPLSLISGILAGILGIGGSIVLVPIMIIFLGIPVKIAIGSNALLVGMTGLGGFAGRVLNNDIDWKWTLLFAAFIFIGSRVGAGISVKTDKVKLKKYFALFLIVVSILILFKL